MRILTKESYFRALLKKIFGTTKVMYVNDYVDNSSKFCVAIKYDGSWFYDIEYNAYHREKYEKLFSHALCGKNMFFINDHDIIKEGEKAKIIARTIDFFKQYDISINNELRRTVSDDALCRVFLSALCDVILPTVFKNNNRNENFEKNNAYIKSKLQGIFSGFELGYIVHNHAKANELEFIYDSEYKFVIDNGRSEDLYAVPIDTAKFVCDIILPCSICAVNIGIQESSDNNKYIFNSIIGNYQKYPLADDEPFIDPWIEQVNHYVFDSPRYKKDSYFPITDYIIPNQYFIPRYFYYVTRINEDIINKYNDEIMTNIRQDMMLTDNNGNVILPKEESIKEEFEFKKLDHSKLDSLLIKRAVKDFRLKHAKDISEYYRNVMTYVEDMIRRISTADYSGDNYDVEVCQRFTEHFNINYGKIIEFIEEDDCVAKCYELIEEAIMTFASYLERNTLRLAEELKEYQSYGILSHYNNIKEYVASEKLQSAIRVKAKKISQLTVDDMNVELLQKNIHCQSFIKRTIDIMNQYQKTINTYEYMYNVIKNYLDTLGKMISEK